MDLIERRAAIKTLEKGLPSEPLKSKYTEGITVGFGLAITWIEQLPSAQPQRWIPCSEKLPENGHYYLWCSYGGNVQSDYYWDGFENGKKFGYNIIAWMPLPEPYKEEQE